VNALDTPIVKISSMVVGPIAAVLRDSTVRNWEAAGRPPSGHRPGEGETGDIKDVEKLTRMMNPLRYEQQIVARQIPFGDEGQTWSRLSFVDSNEPPTDELPQSRPALRMA
jgi:hypothetical protein